MLTLVDAIWWYGQWSNAAVFTHNSYWVYLIVQQLLGEAAWHDSINLFLGDIISCLLIQLLLCSYFRQWQEIPPTITRTQQSRLKRRSSCFWTTQNTVFLIWGREECWKKCKCLECATLGTEHSTLYFLNLHLPDIRFPGQRTEGLRESPCQNFNFPAQSVSRVCGSHYTFIHRY